MTDASSIEQCRSEILSRIRLVSESTDRSEPDLIAVSKVQPDERIEAALKSGQTIYGENRVQEAEERWGGRFAEWREKLILHMIGPLQTNKVKAAVALFDVIQTIDREKLVRHIVKAADEMGRCPALYIQVNIGDEPQKSGLRAGDVPAFMDYMYKEYGVTFDGLMCIPPQGEPAAPHFWRMEKLSQTLGLPSLSMGMSADYETAIAFGATHVRVGSALFGPRVYS